MILLDTHAALWLANNDPALGRQSLSIALEARDAGQLSVSAISFWEIALLAAKGRLRMHRPVFELRRDLLETGILEVALTGDIAVLSVDLEAIHGDPADRFIVATAVMHDATLITADRALLRWKSKLPRQNAAK